MVCLLLSACGDIEWFPDNNNGTGTGGTTVTAPTLSASLSPTAMLDGGSSTLTFKITNKTGNPAQTGMAFVETFPSGFTGSVATPLQCGGNMAVSTSGTSFIFIGGELASGTASCTITADLILTSPLLNTIISDQTFTLKSTDFGSFQGGLVNGVADMTFKVFPAAATSGVVTVSLLTISDPTDDGSGPFTIEVSSFNNSSANVNATVTVVAVDVNGAQIDSTLTTITGVLPPVLGQLTSAPKEVPPADAAKISFWRVLSVVLQ